jgi:hypothetical protein
MNALIGPGLPDFRGPRHHDEQPAIAPFVHHSSPLGVRAAVGRRIAVVVSARDRTDIVREREGRDCALREPRQQALLLSSVPNSLSGCGTPTHRCAESSATIAPHFVPTIPIAWPYVYCDSPSPPYSRGI